MPAVSELTSDQVNALRSGGFASEIRFAVTPNTVIWQATVNQTITGNSFISFLWDGGLSGSRTNVVVGMTFLITATSDPDELRSPLLRGRVTQSPSATTFYCNESSINLTDGMILTVINSFEILQKDRAGNLVDGFQTFEDLAPLVKNMQAFYYKESAVSASFSFAPTGQAMAQGATISSYAWVIAGATYTTGSAETQNITVTVTAGHRWAYLTVTDSNGVSLLYAFEILVCLRDNTSFMYMAHDDVTINGSIETGWNVTTTFFDGIESLLNRTRCAIVAFDTPKTGATDLFNNVVFVGYIVQETTEITGDAVSSTLSQTQFELQGFATIAAQLPVPSLPVRNDATPDEWGDMNLPTTQRAISYLLTRYSTLANLCAMDMLVTDSTWFAGEMNFEAGTLLDTVNRLADEINARLIFFPQGDATLEINANFLSDTDRDALPTLLASGNLETQDLYSYSLPVPYYKTVGQVIAGCATFYADGSTPLKLRALAPATARQEGNEQPVVMAQLLEADLSQTDAVSAAKQRVGDLLEYLNPPVNVPTAFLDGWRILTPSTRVWVTYDVAGTDSTRGLPIEPTERFLLQSISLAWSLNGYWDVSGIPRRETQGGLAQVGATISPNQIDTSTPVLPILSDYDAFPADGSLNYDSVDPLDIDLQPFEPFDLSQYTPMTTEDAANAADNTPVGDCAVINPAVKFNSNVSRTTPNSTQLGETYTAYIKGSGRVGGDVDVTFDFTVSDQGFTALPTGVPNQQGIYHAGEGWGRGVDTLRIGIQKDLSASFTRAVVTFTEINGFVTIIEYPAPPYTAITQEFGQTVFDIPYPATPGFTMDSGDSVPLSTTIRLISLALTGPSDEIWADAFYIYRLDDDGVPYDVELNPDGGLLFNGVAVGSPPLFSESHEYEVNFTGIGSPFPFNFQDSDYSNNDNLPLPITVCGPGMGS